MVQQHLQLSWNSYLKCISGGICSLQQNEELVDMTLAADGHFVKVHQMVMALASPYIKELITSTQCQHPVIFLNRISYETLCFLLEYVYTGEVIVAVEKLNKFMEAARDLKIGGLENVKMEKNDNQKYFSTQKCSSQNIDGSSEEIEEVLIHENMFDDNSNVSENKDGYKLSMSVANNDKYKTEMDIFNEEDTGTIVTDDTGATTAEDTGTTITKDTKTIITNMRNIKDNNVQYTTSNHGNIQLILNRYIYFLRSQSRRNYTYRWRCLAYKKSRCPAFVVTKNDVVMQRGNEHTHQFHDKQILKKVRKGSVFSVLKKALEKGKANSY